MWGSTSKNWSVANAGEFDGEEETEEGGTTGRTWRTGFDIGSRQSAVSAIVYNKTAEMARKPAPWVKALHRQYGWDGDAQVTRLEFRLHGPRGLGCWGQAIAVATGQQSWETYDLTRPQVALGRWHEWVPQAWCYLTSAVPGGWLRLAVPDAEDSNRSRWLTDSRWRGVQQLAVVGSLARTRVQTLRLMEARRRAHDRLLSATTTLLALGVVEHGAPVPKDIADFERRSASIVQHGLRVAAVRYGRRTLPRVRGQSFRVALEMLEKALHDRVETRARGYAAV